MSRHHDAIKNDRRWKEARAGCLERDGYACVRCGAVDQLQADHIRELSRFPELGFDLDNLQTLCQPCHVMKAAEGPAPALIRHPWVSSAYPELAPLIL